MVQMNDHDRSTGRDVDRRRFLKTAGAAGAIGLTGFAGNAAGDATQEQVTIQWAASQEEASEQEAFNEALRSAGMPENITVEFLTGGDVTGDRRNQYQ